MQRMIEKILNYYGRDMVISRAGEEFPVRGFLQVVTGTAKQKTQVEVCPLGTVKQGRYVYIGPLEPRLQMEDTLMLDGTVYIVRQAENVSGAYVWAMCVEKGSEDAWGVNG